MVCFLVYFVPSCLGKDCRWLLRIHEVTNWPVDGLKNQKHFKNRGTVSKHIKTVCQLAGRRPSEWRKERRDIFSILLSARASFPSSCRSRRSQAWTFENLVIIKTSKKPNCRLLIFVARGAKLRVRERSAWGGEHSSMPRHLPPACCGSGPSGWQAPLGQGGTDLTCSGRRWLSGDLSTTVLRERRGKEVRHLCSQDLTRGDLSVVIRKWGKRPSSTLRSSHLSF